MLSRGAFLVVTALIPAAMQTRAEENCGSMLRAMSRFHGKVISIRNSGGGEETPNAIESDSRFAVTIEVLSVEPGAAAPRVGETLTFGLHSASRTFGAESMVGQSLDLESERMDCDGVFRQFLTLGVRRVTAVEPFEGRAEVGHTYRAKAVRTADGDLSLGRRLELPMHHDGGLSFVNLDASPELAKGKASREIQFEVVARRISQEANNRWLSIFEVEIKKVQLQPATHRKATKGIPK